MQSEDRLRSILSDLGKSTMRGIRKCPKCGTFNGTRGLSCKNKECNTVFKEAGDKRKQPLEVVKLNTGSSTQIFSVRVRDKGPDYRGFVQLPITQPNLDDTDASYLSQVSALCFVDSCQRLFNTNILKCHERQAMSVTTCSHIQLAMRCCIQAQILNIENDAIQSLNIPALLKESICELANQTPGPLVQRVSKNIMAVKCKVTTKHPLGYLHVSFFTCNKFKENHFTCTCNTYKNQAKSSSGDKNCVHYYACIAAFSSNPKYSEEFSSFIVKERIQETFTIEISSEGIDEEEKSPLVAILENTINQDVEVDDKDLLLPDITQDFERLSSVVDVGNDLDEGLDQHTLESMMKPEDNFEKKTIGRKRKDASVKSTSSKRKVMKKDLKKQLQMEEPVDESKIEMSFIEWLSSVTERINQTMHYQFDGKPDPLVFHAPHNFFECLLNRFMSASIGARRKRLPNYVTTFTRKNAPPLGTFHNYTWHITNILHAKAIFDTPLMSLNVSRGFTKNLDGTYEEFDPKDLEEGMNRRDGQPAIQPVEYKTYLKIGNTVPHQEVPSVLAIDWTPNVLPLSKIGELKITFQYGHSPQPGT